MNVRRPDSIQGLLLHDSCWRLLEKVLEPAELSLQRLFEIYESLTSFYPGNFVLWGHDYGAHFDIDLHDAYPWETPFSIGPRLQKWRVCTLQDPFNVPEMSAILSTYLGHLPQWRPEIQQTDCFSKLPWEILEAIAVLLSTKEALGLRLVSTAFVPILWSGTFWASRFKPGGERDFIFDGWESRATTDWMSLYRLTSSAHLPKALEKRRRIWDFLRSLTNLMRLGHGESTETFCADRGLAGLRSSQITADILKEPPEGDRTDFYQGCRQLGTQIAHLPSDLCKIGFSISSVGNISHIAGIRLVRKNRPDICLGYTSGNEVIHEMTMLSGFVLAVASSGLRALQLVNQDDSRSDWIGCPNGSAITERLARLDSIAALEVGFDVSTRLNFEGLSLSRLTSPFRDISLSVYRLGRKMRSKPKLLDS